MKRPVSESGLKFKSLFEKIRDVQQDNSPSSSFSRGEASSSFAIKDIDFKNPKDKEKHESGRLPQPLTNDLVEYFKELITQLGGINATNFEVKNNIQYLDNIPYESCFLFFLWNIKDPKLNLNIDKFNRSIINDAVAIKTYIIAASNYNSKSYIRSYIRFTSKNYDSPNDLKDYTHFKTVEE